MKPTISISSKETVLKSETLLGSHKVITIQHGDQQYHLRHTSKGKLILTK